MVASHAAPAVIVCQEFMQCSGFYSVCALAEPSSQGHQCVKVVTLTAAAQVDSLRTTCNLRSD